MIKKWLERLPSRLPLTQQACTLTQVSCMQAEIDELRQENARLRDALADIAYGLEGSRIWGGMEWSYAPLHPFKYLPLRDKARAALGES